MSPSFFILSSIVNKYFDVNLGWDVNNDEEHYPKQVHDKCRTALIRGNKPSTLASATSFDHLIGYSPPRKKQRTTCYVANLEKDRRPYRTEKKILLLNTARGKSQELRPALKEIKKFLNKKCEEEEEDIIEAG